MRFMIRASVVTVVLVISGCSAGGGSEKSLDCGSSDAGCKKACPAGGLGVTSTAGKKCEVILDHKDPDLLDCQEQIQNYKDYGCSRPQVCFDQNFQQGFGFTVAPSAPAYRLSFVITNCSTGNEKLVIQSVKVLGDEKCSFAFDTGVDVEKLEIPPGEFGLVSARYLPTKLGEDHAVLVLHTNAENFPTLKLYACGTGIPRFAAGLDSGSAPDSGLPAGTFFCKDKTTVASCHQ